MLNELIFRNISGHQGRKLVITPQTAKTEYLSVGYINLSAEVPSVRFSTDGDEKIFMCMSGSADVSVNGVELTMGTFDGLYVPRDSSVEFTSKGNASILESSAPVTQQYPLKLVRWADIKDDPKLHASIGPETMHRELYQLVTEHVQAGRLLLGPTFSNKGNWTSWPPHEHRDTLEEVYVYFNMPAPAFGIQLAYNDLNYPDVMFPVRENDAMVVHHGFHPNVAIPGHSINFVWILCAKKEVTDRKWGVVNVQPEFKQ
jgi:5-deoxy-glucuronate isomerase